MNKKVFVGFFLGLSFLTLGIFVQRASAEGFTFAQLIELFIQLGVIAPDKATAARGAVSGLSGGSSTGGDTTSTSCAQMTRDLTIGSSGSDVRFLQTKLGGRVTGYFGSETQALVKKFQANNGILADGFFGVTTREKFNTLYCPSVPAIPVNPTSTLPVACTADAKLCPDGSYVGRDSNNRCEFRACPNVVRPSSGSAVVVGSPTIALVYDSANKESALTATFNVSVTAGSSDLQIYMGSAGTYFVDQSGHKMYANTTVTPLVKNNQTGDNFGRSFAIVSAGTTATFQVKGTANPKVMFAGNYYGTLQWLYSNSGDSQGTLNQINLAPNQTNSKTIIGEVSPYIVSISPTVISSGQTLTINGQRLGGSTLFIDGASVTSAYNGTGVTVVIPSLLAGFHNLYLNNPSTGRSNAFTFQVQGGSDQPSSASVSIIGSPVLELAYDSQNQESQLVATFNLTVTAGNSGLNLFTSMANAYFADQNNKNVGSLNSFQVQVGVASGEKLDQYGRNYIPMSPNQSVQMTVTLKANPKHMFAGTYHAVLGNLYALNPNDPGGNNPLYVASNQTNSKTIVGEVSPYITSISRSQSGPGGTITILGQRLGNTTVLIDGVASGFLPSSQTTVSSVSISDSLFTGNHTIQLSNSSTGASNVVGFIVSGGSTQPPVKPVITSITPSSASADGKTPVVIKGSGFDSTSMIYFNTKGGTDVKPNSIYSSGNELMFYVPSSIPAGSYSIQVLTTNPSNGQGSASSPFPFTVNTAPLVVTTLSPSTWNKTIKLGESISQMFVVNEQTPNATTWNQWALEKGSWPSGISIGQFGAFSGELKGTPGQTGTYSFSIGAYSLTGGYAATAVVNLTVTTPTPLTSTISLSASPTVINPGQTTVLSWSTTNVTSCSLSGPSSASYLSSSGTKSVTMTSTGTFTITCLDSSGSPITKSVTVTVNPIQITPTISVLSPNGGEKLQTGVPTTISWKSSNVNKVNVSLRHYPDQAVKQIGVYDASLGAISWTPTSGYVGGDWALGDSYKIEIFEMDSGSALAKDQSDSYISFVTPQTQPSVTVLSPNGGENLVDGSNVLIKWTSTGLSSADYLHIMLTDSSGADKAYIAWWLPGTQTEYNWKVGTGIGGAAFSPSINGGSYKVKIYTSTGSVSDLSNSTFTVNGATSYLGGSNSASAFINLSDVLKLLEVLKQ